MPIAEPFGGGIGNGFPECIPKVDMTVDTGGTWAPPVINALTLEQAMSLYWNLYGIIGTASATRAGETVTVSDVNIPDADTPMKRACAGDYYGSIQDSNPSFFLYARQSVNVYSSFIIAMYNGVTTDESNFLGYSLWFVASSSADNDIEKSYTETILFAGHAPAPSDSDAWTLLSTIYFGTPPTLTNVTFQGIPFITAELNSGTTGVSATITDVSLYTYA